MNITRRSLLIGAALASASRLGNPAEASADLPWKKAPALRSGDLIRFVAPAGPVDLVKVEACRKRIEALGFRVAIPEGIGRKDRYLAGTDKERLDELNAAIRDPKARAIFPIRGGYGLMRILPGIDYRAIRDDPKIITGFSDLTALHLAIARNSRVVTLHSPVPQGSLYRVDGDYAYASEDFWRTVRGEGFDADGGRDVTLPQGRPAPGRVVGGRATGRLVGGNLTLICSTLGTPYAVEGAGNLLLIEDTGEAPYRVDRMFAQLRLSGILDRVGGLLIGTFDETDGPATEAVVREHCSKLKVPVILNYPVGHTPFNATLPLGSLVQIDADAARVRLLENPVSTG